MVLLRCPNHRRRVKGHTHLTTEYRTYKNWLNTDEGVAVNTTLVTEIKDDVANLAASAVSSITRSEGLNDSSIMALLVSAMNLMGDSDEIKDLITEAFNALDST